MSSVFSVPIGITPYTQSVPPLSAASSVRCVLPACCPHTRQPTDGAPQTLPPKHFCVLPVPTGIPPALRTASWQCAASSIRCVPSASFPHTRQEEKGAFKTLPLKHVQRTPCADWHDTMNTKFSATICNSVCKIRSTCFLTAYRPSD